jgi:peptidoglycan hydrolase-like protein with peptidoglycan-binding domain
LAYGVSGADVKQLNDNLAEMGYADRDDLSKSKFDWRTRRAVCAWQQDLKLRRTGVLEPGEIVFLPGQVRVGSVDAALGSMVGPGAALISVTGTDQIVTIDLDAALRGTLNEGLAVEVVLPDRTQLDATVASIGRTITGSTDPDAETEPTVKVAVELDGDADELDASPVSVVVERVLVADALAVPVGALVARPGGGYAVERKTAGGVELVPVEPGQFSDGLVEVTGDIAEGDEVVVPS